MNIAKDFCDCIISWEVQENKKISSILYCSSSQSKPGETNTSEVQGSLNDKILEEVEMDCMPVLLIPFLHPELIKASYCEMKIFVSPKLSAKVVKLLIISSAKMIDFFELNGEISSITKSDKGAYKHDRCKNDSNEISFANNSTKSQKSSSRWFVNEYVPTIDSFEIMLRFCDLLVQNQLLIKYIGVKVDHHDWQVDVASCNLATAAASSNIAGHLGSACSICTSSMTLNCDKVMDAIQTVNNAMQTLANEIGCVHRGSNPHLPTISSLDTGGLLKHRRPNSPMTSNIGPISPNYWTGISNRRSSDIVNLQMWLETRLTAIEVTIVKQLEHLSSRVSQLELQMIAHNPTQANNNIHNNTNDLASRSSSDQTPDSNNKLNESSNDRNLSCQKL